MESYALAQGSIYPKEQATFSNFYKDISGFAKVWGKMLFSSNINYEEEKEDKN